MIENTVSKALESCFVWGEKQNMSQGFLSHCNIVCFVMRFKFLQNVLNKKEEVKHLHMRILEEEEEGEASKHNKTTEF